MGLSIVAEDENGLELQAFHDPRNILHTLLPSQNDTSFVTLRFVDWVGDTVFNRLQIGDFIFECERLLADPRTDEQRETLGHLLELARLVASRPHRYLRFVGD